VKTTCNGGDHVRVTAADVMLALRLSTYLNIIYGSCRLDRMKLLGGFFAFTSDSVIEALSGLRKCKPHWLLLGPISTLCNWASSMFIHFKYRILHSFILINLRITSIWDRSRRFVDVLTLAPHKDYWGHSFLLRWRIFFLVAFRHIAFFCFKHFLKLPLSLHLKRRRLSLWVVSTSALAVVTPVGFDVLHGRHSNLSASSLSTAPTRNVRMSSLGGARSDNLNALRRLN